MGPLQHMPAALEAWLAVTCRSVGLRATGPMQQGWGAGVLHAPFPMAQTQNLGLNPSCYHCRGQC